MYGYERDTMPALSQFASETDTTVLHNGIAQSLWTPASSASMLTGTYLSTHRVGQDGEAKQRLPSHVDTLPELLSDLGYQTALFSPNPYLSPATGLDKGLDHVTSVKAVPESWSPTHPGALDYWIEGLRRLFRSRRISLNRIKHELKPTENEVLERRTCRWIERSKSKSTPFFAYAHIPGPHYPYMPNTDYLEEFTDDISLDAEEAYSLVEDIYYGSSVEINEEIVIGINYSDEEWEGIEAMYDATLRHMDDTISEIVATARAASDSLIIVVVGDHGELFGDAGCSVTIFSSTRN
jgi:uncharacterized sulfatase